MWKSVLMIPAALLFGCGSQPSSVPDPARTAADGERAEPSQGVIRFAAAEAGAPDVGAARLQVRSAGKISIADGKLAVADAFINDAPLVIADLPNGDYAVNLLVAESGSDARVAAARLHFTNEPPAEWRRVGYFGVDSGTGAFFDPRISSTITPSNVTSFNAMLLKTLEETQRPTYSVANVSWEGMTYVAFSTGWGDGSYPIYIGLSAAGTPVTIVVDCEVLPWPR